MKGIPGKSSLDWFRCHLAKKQKQPSLENFFLQSVQGYSHSRMGKTNDFSSPNSQKKIISYLDLILLYLILTEFSLTIAR